MNPTALQQAGPHGVYKTINNAQLDVGKTKRDFYNKMLSAGKKIVK